MQASKCIGLGLSVGAHLLIGAALLRRLPDPVVRTPPPSAVEVVPLAQAARRGRLDAAGGGFPACAPGRSIVGIGMEMNERHVVILVPTTYPAFQAGLRLGDLVLNPAVEPDAAGYDAVNFRRKGRLHRLIIRTRRICMR